jgi:hypothetical protein
MRYIDGSSIGGSIGSIIGHDANLGRLEQHKDLMVFCMVLMLRQRSN